ncbi:MAG: hypothetical protein ACE5HZ_06520 [Fidelibacterota bacterium]
MSADVVVLAKDFEMGTRIADAISAQGKKIDFPENAAGLDGVLSEETRLMIIDLEEESYHPLDLVKRVRNRFPQLSVVGFHSQVRKDSYMQARKAGCSWVFSRSSLVKNLRTLLAEGHKENGGDDG